MQVPGQRPISASNPRPKPVYGRKQFSNATNNPSSGAPKAVFGSYAQSYGTISSSQLASIQGRKSWLGRTCPQYVEVGTQPLRGTSSAGISPYVESVGYYKLGRHHWSRTWALGRCCCCFCCCSPCSLPTFCLLIPCFTFYVCVARMNKMQVCVMISVS